MCFNSATVRPPAADILHLKMISVSLIEGMWRQDDLAGEWADLSDLRILVCYLKHMAQISTQRLRTMVRNNTNLLNQSGGCIFEYQDE